MLFLTHVPTYAHLYIHLSPIFSNIHGFYTLFTKTHRCIYTLLTHSLLHVHRYLYTTLTHTLTCTSAYTPSLVFPHTWAPIHNTQTHTQVHIHSSPILSQSHRYLNTTLTIHSHTHIYFFTCLSSYCVSGISRHFETHPCPPRYLWASC